MATNPRIPEHRDVPTLVEQKRKKSSAPWVLFGIFVAAIILAAIIIWLPRAPKKAVAPTNAVVPFQATGSQVQISQIRLSPAPTGQQMYIYARINNAGTTTINALRVNVAFPSDGARPAGAVTADAESYANGESQPLSNDPIKPNEARDVRIPVDVPAGWNHQTPEIKIQDVGSYNPK